MYISFQYYSFILYKKILTKTKITDYKNKTHFGILLIGLNFQDIYSDLRYKSKLVL